MTDKQKMFADEYLANGLQGAKAYKAVYKTVKSDGAAYVNASKLLAKEEVKDYIQKRLEEIRSEKTADAAEVIMYLTSVMRGEQKDELLTIDGDAKEVRVNTRDRNKAAELLGKVHGIFEKNVNLSVEVPVFQGEADLED